LQFARLIGSDFLCRRALFVEDVVEGDADGDGVADMGGEVWAGDTERDGGVVDGVDEVVHGRCGEVHESVNLFHLMSTWRDFWESRERMYLCLRRRARIFWKFGR